MTNDEKMTKPEARNQASGSDFSCSDFGLHSSFVIRTSSFCTWRMEMPRLTSSGHLCRDGDHRLEFLEPRVNLGQRFGSPPCAVHHQRNRRPDDPVGEAGVFVRLEQQVQFAFARQTPTRRSNRLPVLLE